MLHLGQSEGELWHIVEETARTVPGWVAFRPEPESMFAPSTTTRTPSAALTVIPATAPSVSPPTAPTATEVPQKKKAGIAIAVVLAAIGLPFLVWLSARERDKEEGG